MKRFRRGAESRKMQTAACGSSWAPTGHDRTRHASDQDEAGHRQDSESGPLTSEMRGRIEDLREQLEAERQAHAEARRIIAGLVERIPAIEAPAETPGSPQTVEEEPDRAERAPLRYDRGSGGHTASLVVA